MMVRPGYDSTQYVDLLVRKSNAEGLQSDFANFFQLIFALV